MRKLDGVELISINCVNPERSVLALLYSMRGLKFDNVSILSNRKPTNLTDEINFVEIPNLFSTGKRGLYSEFCINELKNYIQSDHVLMIHDDGFVLNPDLWDDEFLKYDYIGAPWPDKDGVKVGNGGFCMRSRKLIELCSKMGWNGYDHEDWQICVLCPDFFISNGCKFAPIELALKFSLELQIPGHDYDLDKTFGFHGKRSEQHLRKIKLLNEIS